MNNKSDINLGKIIILNGAPRSGKTSIVNEIQNAFDGIWINLGVDNYKNMIPERYQPGIGLRPGGERPDLEEDVVTMYKALYESIRAHSRLGLNVVVDIGHHDLYSSSLGILPQCIKILEEFPVLFVGVKCPIDEIIKRRIDSSYPVYEKDGTILNSILLWQDSVHVPGIYDLEVDTSLNTSYEIAMMIQDRLNESEFIAINKLEEYFKEKMNE